jgi:hypothetical protein
VVCEFRTKTRSLPGGEENTRGCAGESFSLTGGYSVVMVDESRVTTTRRELTQRGDLTWGDDGQPWGEAVETSSGVAISEGALKPESGNAIPDSVVYQARAEDFGSPWPFNIGGTDMSVNAMVQDTFSNGEASVFGDGADDYGLASGPSQFPQRQTFGLAVTIQTTGADGEYIWGVSDNSANTNAFRFAFFDGEIFFDLRDGNDNSLDLVSDSTFDDGSPHAVIINKYGNSESDLEMYVDDTATPVSVTTNNSGFDNTTYSQDSDLGFFARNSTGDIQSHGSIHAGVFEFNSEPYSESEREGFVSRRPEV